MERAKTYLSRSFGCVAEPEHDHQIDPPRPRGRTRTAPALDEAGLACGLIRLFSPRSRPSGTSTFSRRHRTDCPGQADEEVEHRRRPTPQWRRGSLRSRTIPSALGGSRWTDVAAAQGATASTRRSSRSRAVDMLKGRWSTTNRSPTAPTTRSREQAMTGGPNRAAVRRAGREGSGTEIAVTTRPASVAMSATARRVYRLRLRPAANARTRPGHRRRQKVERGSPLPGRRRALVSTSPTRAQASVRPNATELAGAMPLGAVILQPMTNRHRQPEQDELDHAEELKAPTRSGRGAGGGLPHLHLDFVGHRHGTS